MSFWHYKFHSISFQVIIKTNSHTNTNTKASPMFSKLILGTALTSAVYLHNQQKSECCGIFGVVSRTPMVDSKPNPKTQKITTLTVESLLSNGVELLKNRGYDSAGIVSFNNNPHPERMLAKFASQANKSYRQNCIERLVEKFTTSSIGSTIGIAHTRWATCGQVNEQNSHPHYDENQSLYLVHNGIINNHAEVKNHELNGVKFRSETDTEVVVQLLGKWKKEGLGLEEGFAKLKDSFNEQSYWGIVLIDKNDLNTIYTSTRGQPILVGFSPNMDQIYVASERIAFQEQADCYFETNDDQVWKLNVQSIPEIKKKLVQEDRLILLDNNTEVLKYAPEPYPNFYSYELRMQGEIPFQPEFTKLNKISFGDYLSMLACGSSYYASMASSYYFKHLGAFKKINVYDPVELQPQDITQNETVVLISQSGQTKDLINIVQGCKKKIKVKTVGIINVEGSTLARKTDYPIYIKVGREVSVGATKSFFHQVLNLIYFATLVAEKKQSCEMALIKEIRDNLLRVPEVTKQTIEMVEKPCRELASIIAGKESVYLLALRETLAIAREAALKIKELNYIHAEAMGACEMKHGPIALVNSEVAQETTVFLFILDNDQFNLLMNTLDQMHSRKAYVVVITDCKKRMDASFEKESEEKKISVDSLPKKYHFMIEIPNLPKVNHLLAVVPMQILVEYVARIKGINPDMPRNLAKAVTVE